MWKDSQTFVNSLCQYKSNNWSSRCSPCVLSINPVAGRKPLLLVLSQEPRLPWSWFLSQHGRQSSNWNGHASGWKNKIISPCGLFVLSGRKYTEHMLVPRADPGWSPAACRVKVALLAAEFACHLLHLCQIHSSWAFLRYLCTNTKAAAAAARLVPAVLWKISHWISDILNYMPKQKQISVRLGFFSSSPEGLRLWKMSGSIKMPLQTSGTRQSDSWNLTWANVARKNWNA